MTMAVAPSKNLLENGFILKIDVFSDRQFQALNHWNAANAVSDIVWAFTKSMLNSPLKINNVPAIMAMAINNILRAINGSTRNLLGFLNFSDNKFFSWGSIARATTINPSVTKLSHMICVAKRGIGYPKKIAPVMVNISPKPVEKRYKITFLMVL